MRPLDFLGRIKVKLGIVIVLAVVVAFVVNEVGINASLSRDLRIAIAVVLALIMVQLLARGMTRPLREMAAAAQTIAKGRYGLRVTATSRDEVGELARAFNAMAADLAEVDRQRRELVANVSHELRTPITGLQAVLENVVDGVTPPDLDTLGTALAQTQRLGRLVAQLLDLSRLDSGARLIEPEELDLASLCRQAVSEAAIARDDVTVVNAVTPGTALPADGALLAQVLANLLDNAVRHSPPGGMVRVEARSAGPNLEISVTDQGPGIPQAERARVFERFSRLDAGRAADAGGAGLGLAIAKEIVELHGGSISVADPLPAVGRPSERDRGTAPGCRMVVALPRHREQTAEESVEGPVRAGERRHELEIRRAGAGRLIGSPGGEGSPGDGGDPAVSGARAADGPENAGDTAASHSTAADVTGSGSAAPGSATGQVAASRSAAAHAAAPGSAAAQAIVQVSARITAAQVAASPPVLAAPGSGAERPAPGARGEDAWPPAPLPSGGGDRPGDRQTESPGSSHESPAPPRGAAEPAHAGSVNPGVLPDGGEGGDDHREGSGRPGLVHSGAGRPDQAAGGAGQVAAGQMAPGQVAAGQRFASQPGAADDSARHLARAALGAGVGMFAGFTAGLIAPIFLGVRSMGILPLVLFTAVGAVAGATRGSSTVRRSASASSPPSSAATPTPGPPGTRSPDTRVLDAQRTPDARALDARALDTRALDIQRTRAAQHGSTDQSATPPPAYVPPPLFPQPDLPEPPRRLLPAAAAAGLVAALTLPYASAGLGLVLTAVAMGAVVFPSVLPLRRGRVNPWTLAFGVLGYALVSVAIFRDAEWLVVPVLLAAFGMGSLALSGGGRGWLAMIRGAVSVAFAVLPTPWFLAGPLRALVRRRRRMLPTLVGAAVTVVLLAVFGLLFSSADAVFSAFLSDLLETPEWARSLPYRAFVFCVFAVLAAAAVLVGMRPAPAPATPDLRMPLGRQVWVIPLAGLNLLFAAFVTVQVSVLSGGSRRVLSTARLTYAEYARSGFFELVTVSVFVLAIVAAAVALVRPRGRADRWLLAVLLGLLCAFTLVVLASALHRLGLYTDAYGLSRLRASVEATIWWLGAVFVLVLVAGAMRLFGGVTAWFSRGIVLLTGVSLLVFAVWDPDARVAETQLTVRGVERLDHGYLSELGAEAVPILDRLPEPDRSCVLREVVAVNGLYEPDPWNGWNLARARARELLERKPLLRPVDCAGSSRVPGPSD
ncbi:DUF4153 domain-containing protein [Microbispora sp. H11081]|uniref:DUF4153 domain-containing protein n=1 Tax=Microbispora sp. H11081 TaxID=2729107 RepID=UPI001473B880|nr:DUF4153 domain-containing protein [Microbispora sp. H11081]